MFNKKEQKNTEEKKVQEGNKGKVLTGTVTSNKMDKTAVVRVDQYKKHPKYHKFISSKKNYKIHDEENTLNIGDKVEIIETNPISKDKRFKLSNIIEKAVIVDVNE
jgi:small subunit ribosomal protein S17